MSHVSRIIRESRAWLRGAASTIVIALAACAIEPSSPASSLDLPPPEYVADAARGAAAYRAHCLDCHGAQARGTERGPPLVHRIYRSSHHSDLAFFKAVQRGVHAHHWHFGDMPPVAGVDPRTTADIAAFVRAEQTKAGLEP